MKDDNKRPKKQSGGALGHVSTEEWYRRDYSPEKETVTEERVLSPSETGAVAREPSQSLQKIVYPNEDREREKAGRQKKVEPIKKESAKSYEYKRKGPSIGGIIGWTFFGLVLVAIVGVFVWAVNTEPSSKVLIGEAAPAVGEASQTPVISVQNPPVLPNILPQMTETTNGKTGREMKVIRDFTGTVVAYKGFDGTPVVVFDIGGVQQQYQFRMGNDGKVAVGGTYKVRLSYWHSYWDFSAVEQIK